AIDADVQKAAEKQPKQKKCCGKKPGVSGKIEYVQGLLRIWKLMVRLYARRMTCDLGLGIYESEGRNYAISIHKSKITRLPNYPITKFPSVLVGNPQDVSGKGRSLGIRGRQVSGPVDLLAIGQA